jgi:hypothetical protein
MSIITFIIGLGIGFGVGTGYWRTILAKLGRYATAASTSTAGPFAKAEPVPMPVDVLEKKD